MFRDATVFKMIYAFGLRRREVAMLDLHDFTRNPDATEFGRFGVCNVRWGKATRGSQPRRRAVLAVFDWTRPVLEEYVCDVLPMFDMPTGRCCGRPNGSHASRAITSDSSSLSTATSSASTPPFIPTACATPTSPI